VEQTLGGFSDSEHQKEVLITERNACGSIGEK